MYVALGVGVGVKVAVGVGVNVAVAVGVNVAVGVGVNVAVGVGVNVAVAVGVKVAVAVGVNVAVAVAVGVNVAVGVGVGVGLLMVNVSVAVPVPLPFVALSVMLYVPAVVGVPEINPVDVFTVKPAGNGAAPQVMITWSAVIWYEYGTPTVPVPVLGLVILGFGAANALFNPARVMIASATPGTKTRLKEASLELRRSGIMA